MKSIKLSLVKGLTKAPTGIKGFDDITHGGLPSGRTTLLMGEPGFGKTLFALRLLVHGAQHCTEPGIFVAFEEQSERIVAKSSLWLESPRVAAQKPLFFERPTFAGYNPIGKFRFERVAGKLRRGSLDAEAAVLEMRAKPLHTELEAKQAEKTLLAHTTESRQRETSRSQVRIRELRGGDIAIGQGKRGRQ